MQQRGVWPQELRLERAAVDYLCAQRWTGNVRELENILERLAATCGDALTVRERDARRVLSVTVRPPEESCSRALSEHPKPADKSKPSLLLCQPSYPN